MSAGSVFDSGFLGGILGERVGEAFSKSLSKPVQRAAGWAADKLTRRTFPHSSLRPALGSAGLLSQLGPMSILASTMDNLKQEHRTLEGAPEQPFYPHRSYAETELLQELLDRALGADARPGRNLF
jgi:hypothetical protein